MFAFGQSLQKELDVAVGLIVGAVGGTPSGRWINAGMFLSDPGVKGVDQFSMTGALIRGWRQARGLGGIPFV